MIRKFLSISRLGVPICFCDEQGFALLSLLVQVGFRLDQFWLFSSRFIVVVLCVVNFCVRILKVLRDGNICVRAVSVSVM